MIEKTIKVDKRGINKRLDLYLAFELNELTRSAIKKQIEAGNVLINGVIEFRPNYKMREDDEINCRFIIENKSRLALVPEDIPLEVIYEDDSLLAVHKPIGMVVHPATSNWQGTLLNAVLFRNNEIGKVGDPFRPGLIHRLDKDTSGIVLIGKTNEALWYYTKQFSERLIEKTYLAVVRGDFYRDYNNKEIIIDNFIGRNSINRKKFSKVPPSKGKRAITKVLWSKSLTYNNRTYSLLHVWPHTGRTHQIRVHLADMGFPILGDKIYGRNNTYERLMLHAWKLKVALLSGEMVELVANPPESFNKL